MPNQALNVSIKESISLLENVKHSEIDSDDERYDNVVEIIQEGLRVLNCTETELLDIVIVPLNSGTVAEWASDHRVRDETGDYQVINELFYDVRKLKDNPEKLLEHLDEWFNSVIDKTL